MLLIGRERTAIFLGINPYLPGQCAKDGVEASAFCPETEQIGGGRLGPLALKSPSGRLVGKKVKVSAQNVLNPSAAHRAVAVTHKRC